MQNFQLLNFREDSDGDSSWDLNQNRAANTVNEITDVTETAGPSWTTPAYNDAGNMTTVPQPADPTASFAATFDAWNRLVKLAAGANTVAEFQYDAAQRRTIQKNFTGGTLDETRHLYYTEPDTWQVLEERVDSSSDPNRQFIWGLRYQDDLVLRDRDTTGNGTLDERLYGLQDANWNLTALTDIAGDVQERYAYSAYGVPTVLTPSFTLRGSSSFDWETRFAGYRWDAQTELYHVRHRVYHAPLGTWLSRDPLGLSVGANLYEYVDSAPINFSDPSGTDFLDCMAACVDDNDPTNLALAAAIALLSAGYWPKAMFLKIAELLGKKTLARQIRISMKMGGRLTTMPSALSVALRGGGRSALRVLSRAASVVVGPIMIAYGLALAAVETHCLGYCSGCWWYEIEYDPETGSIIESLKRTYFDKWF